MTRSELTLKNRRLEHIASVARAAGIKLTHQRLEIYKELAGTERHPDAEEIFRAVRRRVPTVSIDTVYRTIWLLRDLGLVTTLGARGDSVRFDANLDRHHHYICVRCGLVRDFVSEELNAITVPGHLRAFGSVLDAQVEVRGLCADCQHDRHPSREPGRRPVAPRRGNGRVAPSRVGGVQRKESQ